MTRVVVIGDLMVDVVVTPDGAAARGSDTPSRVEVLGGGSAANTACWLASLGVPVALVAAVGDDALGRVALEQIEAAGVEFCGHVEPGCATGTCAVLLDESGERTMFPDRGANDALSPIAVEEALVTPPDWLHLSGYALLGSGSHPAAQTAMAAAARARMPWSVDAASAAPLRAAGPNRFLRWIGGCEVVFANDDELEALGGVRAVLASSAEVVAKHGASGASWTDGSRSASAPAASTTVLDTTGAGDAFDAGFLAARLDGSDAAGALHAGASLASRAVAQRGARP
jgi:sugar/nucleoside kinase (ribokinase family)